MYGYIYKFTLIPTGKYYIGKHKYNKNMIDESYWGSGKLWRREISQYDKEDWPSLINREILEFCNTAEELNNQEKKWIKYYNSTNKDLAYNISKGGQNPILYGSDNGMFNVHRYGELSPTYGKHWKICDSKRCNFDKSGEKNSMYGKKHSDETKKKISIANKGRVISEETREKHRKGRLGKKHSNETKKKMSENNAMNNPEYRKKVSMALKGKKSPCKNTIWINKEGKTKMIKSELLISYISAGWNRGRK